MKAPSTPSTRIVTALAAGFLAIVLAACGGGGGGDSGGGASATVEKPVITTQPANQSAVVGQSATFTVTATGSATLTYQWKKNGADISGANTNTYTTPATSSADNGAIFLVSVSNSAGTVTSSSATLAVTAAPVAPVITTQPVNQSVVVGQNATFSVVATGGGTITYQWKKNGTDISGATSSTYTTPATSMADTDAVFTVAVSNAAGPVTSAEATLTVTATAVAPSITTQPAAQTVDPGKTASFSVEATGTSPLLYQWKLNGKDITDATSSSYTTPAAAMADSGAAYSVVVSNGAGTVTSSPASLTVTEVPAITTQPAAQSVTSGKTATFNVSATGTGPLAYQWKKNGTDIAGATNSSYTTPATSDADIGAVLAYSVVVTNRAGTVTSSNATLTVTAAPPSITTQPANRTITAGDTATFNVSATGTGTLIYQWKKGSTVIPGATTNSYTTPAMGYAGNGKEYSVVITDSVSTVTSSSATLTVTKTSTLQTYGRVANDSDGLYDKTECVQDNNTGLVWEGKPTTGTRASNLTYTNYDSTTGLQSPFGINVTQADIDASTNSIGYVNSVNAGSGLCGFKDWRLPTKEELQGIFASTGTPRIDTTWFPNTQAAGYWSSSQYVGNVAIWLGTVTFANSVERSSQRQLPC